MDNDASVRPPRPAIEMAKEKNLVDDREWLHIKSIIAAIAVPKIKTMSQASTPVDNDDDSAPLLLPPVVVDTAVAEPRAMANAYGTFDFHDSTLEASTTTTTEQTVVPLHPTTLLASAALSPVYLFLMLLPMAPFWIFAAFLTYVTLTRPLAEIHITLVALAFLVPFNVAGTTAVVRFALGERRKALEGAEDEDVEAGSPVSRRSMGSSSMSEKKRLWRPSMQFVLHGARREGRRL